MPDEFEVMKDHSDYEISKSGVVRLRGYDKVFDNGDTSHVDPVEITPSMNQGQYIITIDKKQYSLHRLVAIQFIDNPNKHSVVTFKDGDKTNVDVSNLMWSKQISGIGNLIQSSKELYGTGPGCKIKCIEDGKVFRSIKAAAEHYDINYNSFRYNFLHNNEIKGRHFEYTQETPNVTI